MQLEAESRCMKLIAEFEMEMQKSIEKGFLCKDFMMLIYIGEEALFKIPSLKLKKWNATRWLGRHKCLEALCRASQHILDHLHSLQQDTSYDKSTRETAKSLYKQFTSYDTFLFLFYYKQITETMANTSKELQLRTLEISDVGRYIVNLIEQLQEFYPSNSLQPKELIGNGMAYEITKELFGVAFDGLFSSSIVFLIIRY